LGPKAPCELPQQRWRSDRYALSRSRTARRASGPLTAFNWVGACTRRTASRPGSARPRCRQPRDCSTALLRSLRMGVAWTPGAIGRIPRQPPRVRSPSKRFICCSLQCVGNPGQLVPFSNFGILTSRPRRRGLEAFQNLRGRSVRLELVGQFPDRALDNPVEPRCSEGGKIPSRVRRHSGGTSVRLRRGPSPKSVS